MQRRKYKKAAAEAEAGLKRAPDSAELWNLLGAALIMVGDPAGGAKATAKALALDPNSAGAKRNSGGALDALKSRYRNALMGLSNPDNEGGRLEEAFHAVAEADDAGVLEDGAKGVSLAVFLRLAAVEDADRRWPLKAVGRDLAAMGEHRSLIYQLPRVRSDEDRIELLEQHRIWGRSIEARAAARPIEPVARGPRSKQRVGFVSSDLRLHAVTAFAEPLIAHAAENGVEVFCYSAQPGSPDAAQKHIASHVEKFRHLPGASATDVARAIASDAPDVLVEIGGSTNANRIEALAHRLAPVQVSWLGYPHSVGLSTIDYMLVDPYLAPPDRRMMLERPLVMPRSWITLSAGFFRENPRPGLDLPEERNGYLTFGSAGSPYKYSLTTLQAWARVLAAIPNSRFLFVRPEGDSPTFRRNLEEHFAMEGVSADRLDYAPVRGGHLPYYAEMDISLDTIPQTGGMTTCEALWMGVPVVTVAGPAVYERLSHSILNNVGLSDLSTSSLEAFHLKALELAGDRERRREWRARCRQEIMSGALGDPQAFAGDFYGLLKGALR